MSKKFPEMSGLCRVFNTQYNNACMAACLCATGILFALPVVAQINDIRLPIALDADSTSYDGKLSMLTFQGLRVTQGNIGIQADSGRASKLDFEDSIWQFSGNVKIDTEQGHIECDSADLKFAKHELLFATIVGTPATFVLKRKGSDDTTYAEAGRLMYDFAAGVIEFTGNAVITEGGNQISSNFLVYNIEEQRINAQSAGEGDPRVKITYTPRVRTDDSNDDSGDDETESQDSVENQSLSDQDSNTSGESGESAR